MTNYKSALIVVSILIAVIVPLLNVVKAERDLLAASVVKFSIEPVDPRDLMYGQYLRFKIKWNWKDGAPGKDVCSGAQCCLCVGEGDVDPHVSMTVCPPQGKTVPECRHIIHSVNDGADNITQDLTTFYNGFDIGTEQYYLDEDYALPVEHLFRDKKEAISIGLALAPTRTLIEELYIGGMSLPEYIEQNRDTLLKDETPSR